VSRAKNPRGKSIISFALPKSLDGRIGEIARQRMTTKSAVIREILANAISEPAASGGAR
jgi:predicted DNA-binding protein